MVSEDKLLVAESLFVSDRSQFPVNVYLTV